MEKGVAERLLAQLMAARTDNEAGQARYHIYRELLLATTEEFILAALFTSQKILQNFLHFPSHRIFRRMHGVLNIDEN